jgi:hypothetical protein
MEAMDKTAGDLASRFAFERGGDCAPGEAMGVSRD